MTIGVVAEVAVVGGATVEVGVVVVPPTGVVWASQRAFRMRTYREPSAVFTSVSFLPSWSVIAEAPLS